MALRVGIVGYGEAGRLHAAHLSRAGADVVGIVTGREIDGSILRYPSVESMLPHVDAVTIAVPNHLHASICLTAVSAGKSVFVEKPLALHERELEELEEALTRNPVPLSVGFRLRFNPKLRALRDQLDSPRRIRCIYRLGIERLAAGKPWTRQRAQSGGAFFTLGVHALDLVRWLARSQEKPLQDLRASARHRDVSADFPLVAELWGRLPGGSHLVAGADLRGEAPFRLELEVNSRSVEDSCDLSMDPDAEYGAMMTDFVQRALDGRIDPAEESELFRLHRDIIHARFLAEGP
jgi:predicted dehydrogenase